MVRYVLAWFAMLVIAVANGALREATFARMMPELRAHQASTLTGCILIGAFIWFVVRAWPPPSGRVAIQIGLIWVAMTVALEFFEPAAGTGPGRLQPARRSRVGSLSRVARHRPVGVS